MMNDGCFSYLLNAFPAFGGKHCKSLLGVIFQAIGGNMCSFLVSQICWPSVAIFYTGNI